MCHSLVIKISHNLPYHHLSYNIQLNFTNWRENQPNNVPPKEECVEMYPDGTWNDNKCLDINTYVCKKPVTGRLQCYNLHIIYKFARVAQWRNALTWNPKVVGSSPAVTNMLCSWVRHFTTITPLYPGEYMVPAFFSKITIGVSLALSLWEREMGTPFLCTYIRDRSPLHLPIYKNVLV